MTQLQSTNPGFALRAALDAGDTETMDRLTDECLTPKVLDRLLSDIARYPRTGSVGPDALSVQGHELESGEPDIVVRDE